MVGESFLLLFVFGQIEGDFNTDQNLGSILSDLEH